MGEIFEKIKDKLETIQYKISDFMGNIRMFWQYSRNKYFMDYMKTAVNSVPFDFGSFMDIQYSYLKFMLNYMEKRLYTTDETYDQIIKWLKYAIAMNEIFCERRNLFHYTKDMDFTPSETHPGCYTVDIDDDSYVCDVDVNVRNIDRFVNEKAREWYVKHPHHLYQEKAKNLYFKILNNYVETWWD